MSLPPPNPVIALWVHPRSMSTAIERVMRERGDLECLHEPFMYYYYVGQGRKELPHSDLHIGRLDNFEQILEDLFNRANHNPVLFKDMGYYVVPELFSYPQWARRMRHVILVRDPRKSILSYHKLDPGVSLEEIGVESQFKLYSWLHDQGMDPLLIEAESVQKNPIETISSLWARLGLEDKPDAFAWRDDEVPKDWQSVAGWHASVISSKGIRPMEESEAELQKRFEQAQKKTPRLKQYLDHHWPYYCQLKDKITSFQK